MGYKATVKVLNVVTAFTLPILAPSISDIKPFVPQKEITLNIMEKTHTNNIGLNVE